MTLGQGLGFVHGGREYKLAAARIIAHDRMAPSGPGGSYVYLFRAPDGLAFAVYLGPTGEIAFKALTPEAARAIYWALPVKRCPPQALG